MNLRFLSSMLCFSAFLVPAYADTSTAAHASPSATASAKELLEAGRVDEAIDSLEQQTQHSPSDAESYNLLCRAYYMIEEWDRGIAACERALNLDPKNSLYHLWLGRVYGEKASHAGFISAAGLAKKVRTSFERSVELDPANWEARSDLAEFYIEAPAVVGGGKDKARQQADALIPLHPAAAYWVLARIDEKEKDAAGAERDYRVAIETSHGTAEAWLRLAQFLARANRWDEMTQALRTMDSSPLDRPDSLMDGGSLLLRTGRDNLLAVRLLRRYLSAPVEDGPAFKAHEALGRLLEKQGDRRAAAEEYRAALALSHTYTRAREDLKRVEH
jgi:tetratricopeptide (TPR) repeat protein